MTHLICSLIAASHSSVNLWRARETCGTIGTRSSSFCTSSKGSNITPVKGRLFAPFEAQTTKLRSFLAAENRRLEAAKEAEEFRAENENEGGDSDDEETEENIGDRVSPCGFKREQDGTVLRSMVLTENEGGNVCGEEVKMELGNELDYKVGQEWCGPLDDMKRGRMRLRGGYGRVVSSWSSWMSHLESQGNIWNNGPDTESWELVAKIGLLFFGCFFMKLKEWAKEDRKVANLFILPSLFFS